MGKRVTNAMNVFQVAQAVQQLAERTAMGVDPALALLPLNELVDRVVFAPLADKSMGDADHKKLKDLKSRYDCGWRKGLEGKLPHEVTAPLLRRIADENVPTRLLKNGPLKTRLSAATQNRRMSALRVVFDQLVERGYMEVNPAQKLKFRPERNQRSRILRDDEVSAFFVGLEQMPPKFRLFMRFTLLSSMRMGEVLACRWPDVSIERREILIPHTKNGKPRVVPISDGLADVLQALTEYHRANDEGEFLFPGKTPGTHMSRPTRQLNKLRELTGLNDLWLHDLRRSAATWACRAGATVHDVSTILGHSNVRVTERYLVAHDPRLHVAMQGADQIFQQLLKQGG